MRKLSTIYPGRITIDGNNPDGTFKNEVTPGVSADGTPLEEQWQQDVWGAFAHILSKASINPDGVQENELNSQVYDALEVIVRTIFTASLTEKGTVEQATSAEAISGSSDAVFPSILGLRQAFNASGAAPVFACRAWVNFNGTGTVAIRASGNVSSITDNGTGNYTVNFTVNMQTVNYAVCVGGSPTDAAQAGGLRSINVHTQTVGSVDLSTSALSSGVTDFVNVNMTIFE